jgi:hypothetical protein
MRMLGSIDQTVSIAACGEIQDGQARPHCDNTTLAQVA